MNGTSSPRLVGATLLAPISWGTTYVTVTELLPAGRPLLVATTRVLPAGVALLIAGVVSSRWRPRGREWRRTSLLAIFNIGIFFPLLIVAVYRLPGGVAAAAGGLQPLLVAALSWLIAGRRPRPLELAVGVVAAIGVALVVIRPGAGIDPLGVAAAVGAAVSFAVGVVLTKRFPSPPNRIASTGWQLLIGGAILVPLTAIVEGPPPSLTAVNLAGFAYLSLLGTALAFVLWFNGIRRLPAAAPPLLNLAAPITGAVMGWVVLGQSLSPVQLTGFAITVAAIGYGASMQSSSADGPVVPEDFPHPVRSSEPPTSGRREGQAREHPVLIYTMDDRVSDGHLGCAMGPLALVGRRRLPHHARAYIDALSEGGQWNDSISCISSTRRCATPCSRSTSTLAGPTSRTPRP